MLAQAEHDVDASAILLTTSKRLAAAVAKEVERQLATSAHGRGGARSRSHATAPSSWCESLDEAIEIVQPLRAGASQHSATTRCWRRSGTRAACSSGRSVPKRRAITLPVRITCCPPAARRGCAADCPRRIIVKVISVQELTPAALRTLAPAITTLARAEGLEAHARSVEVRLDGRESTQAPQRRDRPRPAVQAMAPYSPPTAGRAGKLRLDFNENTVGCSPRVIDASEGAARRRPPGGLSRVRRGQSRPSPLTSASRRSSSSSPTAPTKPSRFSSTPTWTTARKWCC